MHYDVFYQAMNTEYWCPKLVFPQPASAQVMKALLNLGPEVEKMLALTRLRLKR
jgi:hypothetical protein